mmetsp:Transcript_68890/g.128605  ORF Transcript_68890/g.128605 Transcript_68890/m.128605 type:complete len:226 (+) Transcript_68890:88-765(+)
MAMMALRRVCLHAGLRRTLAVSSLRPAALRTGVANFSSAGQNVSKVLENEIKHEDEQYEQQKEIQNFIKNSGFDFSETPGDVNMTLTKKVGNKTVKIEWQLSSPFDPEQMDEEGGGPEATDMVISVESEAGAGLSFYCSTQTGEDHRYVIGQVKAYASSAERDSATSYNGPEFEDLDDKLQEALDEYLAELGMSNEVCDFVDAVALDKEQREYVRWLKTTKTFVE